MFRMMTLIGGLVFGLVLSGANGSESPRASRDDGFLNAEVPDSRHQRVQFLAENPRARLHRTEFGRVDRVFGKAFSFGDTARDSAESFRVQRAGMWGVRADDLRAVDVSGDGDNSRSLIFDRDTGAYGFTVFYYAQEYGGIPVFSGGLNLLVRNDDGFPLVLAVASLHEIDGLEIDGGTEAMSMRATEAVASALLGRGTTVSDVELVIFAGVNDDVVPPVIGTKFVATNAKSTELTRFLYIVDQDGHVVYEENQIRQIDVTGTVGGLATEGALADECGPEVYEPLPFVEVEILGGNAVFADEAGNFVIPHGGSANVTVRSRLRGHWFEVFTVGGVRPEIDLLVAPPGPAEFTFNETNASEFERAEVNAYVHANIVRDFVLSFLPTYPTIANQQFFNLLVNTSDDGTCNAFYLGDGIKLTMAGGGCNNTAFGPIVYHEYTHHLLQVAGTGQGQYGEGMGDVMALLITGEPELGVGFFACDSGIRSADNTVQYPCEGGAHACGQLLSGCVWDTWQALGGPGSSGDDIIADIAINAIVVRGQTMPGQSMITPSITIDYLSLDDDNGDIGDGTPHYDEIATGFGLHGMDAPPLDLLVFQFPDGLPNLIDASGGSVIRVEVTALGGVPSPGTGMLHYDAGAGYVSIPMVEVSENIYDAIFPAMPCGSELRYYFSAELENGVEIRFPGDAPAETLLAFVASTITEHFADDCETSTGWNVQGNATDGHWNRGIPAGGGDRGDPPTDGDGSGACYLTDNVDGNSDVDNGSTILISPIMDATTEGTPFISYFRWYSNSTGAAPEEDVFTVEVSDDAGANWAVLEIVGPSGPEVDGGWIEKLFDLTEVPGFVANDQFRIRFTASDAIDASVIEAGVDGVVLMSLACDAVDPCPEDLDHSGDVGFGDLLIILAEWGDDDIGDLDGDGIVGFGDLLLVLAAWGPCPE